jgi:putative flippase GtrA
MILRRPAMPARRQPGRLLRFCLVGASGVVVNNALLLALVQGLHGPPVSAAAVSAECAIVSNFCLNDRWTFLDRRGSRSWRSRLLSYNLLSLASLIVTVTTVAALHHLVGVHYLSANLAGIAAGTAWNYLSNRRWTYRSA